jgi:hypothetical protein
MLSIHNLIKFILFLNAAIFEATKLRGQVQHRSGRRSKDRQDDLRGSAKGSGNLMQQQIWDDMRKQNKLVSFHQEFQIAKKFAFVFLYKLLLLDNSSRIKSRSGHGTQYNDRNVPIVRRNI